jgi:hypothetical protein
MTYIMLLRGNYVREHPAEFSHFWELCVHMDS